MIKEEEEEEGQFCEDNDSVDDEKGIGERGGGERRHPGQCRPGLRPNSSSSCACQSAAPPARAATHIFAPFLLLLLLPPQLL